MIETLTWKGFTYTVKPFTLDALYTFGELTSLAKQKGQEARGTFEAGCKVLLQGTTAEAHAFADSGKLARDVMTSTEAEKAIAFKSKVDSFSLAFVKRAQGLITSEPASNEVSQETTSKPSRRKSPKNTPLDPAHSA